MLPQTLQPHRRRRFARLIIACGALLIGGAIALYVAHHLWIHRFDDIIARQAALHRQDPDLIWSIIHEETYFRPQMRGEASEVGLMQVTPTVAREWASETPASELTRRTIANPEQMLLDPEHNIRIGCWYLQKIARNYSPSSDSLPKILAAYNAGPTRAVSWNKVEKNQPSLNGQQFIERIDYPTTRAYVTNIIARYRQLKSKQR